MLNVGNPDKKSIKTDQITIISQGVHREDRGYQSHRMKMSSSRIPVYDLQHYAYTVRPRNSANSSNKRTGWFSTDSSPFPPPHVAACLLAMRTN